MTVAEMTYEWIKQYEAMKLPQPVPSTETILMTLNIATNRYLHARYLYGKSVMENAKIIQENSGDLFNLIVRDTIHANITTGSDDPYAGFSVWADMPSSFLHYIRSDSKISRTIPFSIIEQWVQNELVDYSQINNLLTTPFNHPIIEFPKAIFESENKLYVIYDENTTILDDTTINLTYLRKPSKLVLDYTRTACYTVAHTFVAGDKVIITGGSIIYLTHTYAIGETITIIAGTLSITFSSVNTGCLLGDYLVETTTCQFSPYLHVDIVQFAVSVFIDELSLKLMPKQEKK